MAFNEERLEYNICLSLSLNSDWDFLDVAGIVTQRQVSLMQQKKPSK